MLCSQCGIENPASNRFCGECGAKLEAPTPRDIIESETKSRPITPPLDLRDPTDPGRIIVPANGRNAAHIPADEPVSIAAERQSETVPAAHAVGPELDAPTVYTGHEDLSAEPVEPRHYMAAAGEDALIEERPRPRDTSIHGPSLLGLSDDEFNSNDRSGTDSTDYSYLYDDQGGGGRTVNWRLMSALLLVIAFGGALAYMWSQGKSWNSIIVKATHSKTEEPPIVAKTEPTTPGAPEIAVGATQKPVPADEKPQNDKAGDAAAKNNAASANGDTSSPSSADKAGLNANPAEAASGAAAGAADTSTAKPSDKNDDKQTKGSAPSDAAADSDTKQAKASPSKEADDEEDAGTPTTTKSKRAAATTSSHKKGSAAKSAADVEDTEADDTALVHRADALLKSRSCNQAVDLFREAALHGNATARSRLGGLYATGHCVPLDRAEAYNWFTLAKDAGAHYSWIEHNRSMLWAQMSQSERDRVVRR
jgi:hypothetical protein